uniref:Proline-rich protein 5-like n=1 Tax=Scophthalmus maximus TaxID=52904 RepID=A0A8D3BT28_SCOMX
MPSTQCIMGSFRRPRPRFMSSPVLSDLARFHASSPSLQVSNSSVWNSVQSAVIKVFQGGALQTNELFTLNESIRWLLKTEMGDARLVVLGDVWDRFFTETLPTLQAIFYPVQGQELTVRQMALLAFRDLVLLKLHLEETLGAAASCVCVCVCVCVCQGVHESSGPSLEYQQLERLVEVVVSPYQTTFHDRDLKSQTSTCCLSSSRVPSPITVTQHHGSSSLAPLVEQEGEAYLEKAGGVRRHTVANAHSDVRLLLSASGRMHAEGGGGGLAPPPPPPPPPQWGSRF